MLRSGSYDSLDRLGMNDRISSVRPVIQNVRYDNQPEPLSAPSYEFRRRPSERLSEATVTSVHAVMGAPEQRCWMEREQVDNGGRRNVGGAIVGGILGGVLGHQVGSGRGNDAATAVGAVTGAAIGSNAGRSGGTNDRDVQRCTTTASGTPAYWDVTYDFQGREHRVQMSESPGRTVLVNSNGDPRI